MNRAKQVLRGWLSLDAPSRRPAATWLATISAAAMIVAAIQLASPVQLKASRPSRFSITPEYVAVALESAGAGRIDGSQISVEGATALVEQPELAIERIRHSTAGNRIEARLRCRHAGECLPFYAIITNPYVRFSSPPFGARQPRISANDSAPSLQPLAVRSGDRALLRLEGTNLRATLTVVCLNAARQGERVRVRESGGKQLFFAEVIASGLVKGKL
jgi:hypothetical protein